MQLKRFQRSLYTYPLLACAFDPERTLGPYLFLSFFLFSFMMGNPPELYIEAEDTDDDH